MSILSPSQFAKPVLLYGQRELVVLKASGLLAGTYKFNPRKNKCRIAVWGGANDTNLTITLEQLHRIGAAKFVTVGIATLRTGAYTTGLVTPATHIWSATNISEETTHCELVITSASGISGRVEVLWYDVSVQGNYFEVVFMDATTSIAINGYDQQEFYADRLRMARLNEMAYRLAAPGGTGYTKVVFQQAGSYAYFEINTLSTTVVLIQGGAVITGGDGTGGIVPSDVTARTGVLCKERIFDEGYGIQVRTYNYTSAAFTTTREHRLVYESSRMY